MIEKSLKQSLKNNVQFREFVDLILDSWRVILGFGLLGILISACYLIITPNQYEATAQIQMAQVGAINTSNPLGVSIEDPNLLMARIKSPTNFSPEEIKVCALEQERATSESLVSRSKFSAIKGVNSVVELRIRMDSRERAIKCAYALYENIRESQNQILKPHIEAAKIRLIKYQNRLKEAEALIIQADKSNLALASYLASRDEIKFLTNEVNNLSSFIIFSDSSQTKLLSPIYAPESPIFPNKNIVVAVGLLVGLLLGLLLCAPKFSKFF